MNTPLEPSPLAAWLPQLLQTNDSLFPSGSYAHSFGLEGMMQLDQVTDEKSLVRFLDDLVLPGLQQLELPAVHFAFRAAQDGGLPHLLSLDERYGALKGSWELREASLRLGAQRLQMLLHLTPHPLLESLEEERRRKRFQAHMPIVFGVQAALCETPIEAALAAYFYQSVAAQVSAAMKLIRMGQMAGQKTLTRCLSQIQAIIPAALAVTEEEMGWFSPLIDIASAQHETAYTRIFIS